ncbi:hypothetical protein AAF712_016354 [Marasmius tenuissimus]|uniref:Transmembrane protein n=1 Tax=Marasmius tenuissimus TaxID=585030 RepID=A0ABR2Z973_9AGAR
MTGTSSAEASFTFTFEGGFIQVRGAKHSTDPFINYTCQIDNNTIQSIPYNNDTLLTTNLVLCEQQLSEGRHNLTMNITNRDPGREVFWLDSVEYSPLDNASITKQVLKVDSSDIKSCSYHNDSEEWHIFHKDFDSGISWTQSPNAVMSFKFTGTSVSVYGINFGSDPIRWDSTTGSYSIDGGQSILFEIPGTKPPPGLSTKVVARENQPYFETGLVNSGEHEMIITYHGNGTGNPQRLGIDYFYVANNGVEVNGNFSGTGEPGPGPKERADHKVPVGAVVGGILAGIFGLIAFGGMTWLVKRRKRRRGGPREWQGQQQDEAPPSTMSGAWSIEPLEDLRSPTGSGASRYTSGELLAANFASMKHAQREVINGQSRQEHDSGFRYTALHNAAAPPGIDLIPPAYTPE